MYCLLSIGSHRTTTLQRSSLQQQVYSIGERPILSWLTHSPARLHPSSVVQPYKLLLKWKHDTIKHNSIIIRLYYLFYYCYLIQPGIVMPNGITIRRLSFTMFKIVRISTFRIYFAYYCIANTEVCEDNEDCNHNIFHFSAIFRNIILQFIFTSNL